MSPPGAPVCRLGTRQQRQLRQGWRTLIIPNFIDTIRMYRREFDLSYEAAKARAIREFDKRRWPHPYQKGK